MPGWTWTVEHFRARYEHGIWCIEPDDPEALFEIDGKFVAHRTPRFS
jgi:hypothetical protein